MTEITLINALSALVTLGMGLVFFYVIWRHYVVDVTRQDLFELRDQLFDLAAEGKLEFNSNRYKTLRRIFNANIRFTHELDWVHILAFYFAAKFKKKGVITKNAMHVMHLVNTIDDEKTRHEVMKIMTKMHLVTAWHLFRTSFVLLLLTPVVVILVAFFALSAKLLYKTPRKFETLINARAYSIL